MICAFSFCLSSNSFGQQALPPLMPVNVPNFTIPFEMEESASSIREVELFVSKDRGRRWTSVSRQPVESGKFSFRADSDGEYWFTFRTGATTRNVAPVVGQPQLRVLVNTKEPMVILPSQPSETGPLTPPKPERFRGENITRSQPMPTPTLNGEETDSVAGSGVNETETKSQEQNDEDSVGILGPKLPGFDPPDPEQIRGENLLDDLLSGMSPFLDVLPVEVRDVRGAPNHQIAA
jgi:hypothetical protein